MIHWTYTALRPCGEATLAFFWGEAAYGLTEGMRQLRMIRLSIIILAFMVLGFIAWSAAVSGLAAAKSGSDNTYSYYEGKVLEERLTETKRQITVQNDDIRRLLGEINTLTLLTVRLQGQIEKQQEMLDTGMKVLVAVVLTPIVAILWSIFKTGLRRERPILGQHLRDQRDETARDKLL